MVRSSLSLFVGLTVAGLPMATGCNKPSASKEIPPPAVTVATPLIEDVIDYSYFTGQARSTDVVEVRARVQGYLRSVEAYTKGKEHDFTEGGPVTKNELLFIIEPEPYEADLAAAEAQQAQAAAKLKLAEADLARAKLLIEKEAITEQELQTEQAKRDVAEAELQSAKAAVAQARINLGYTTIKAATSGTIGERLVDPGNLVGAGKATLLTTIRKMQPMYVYFDVPERAIHAVLKWRQDHNSNEPMPIYLGFSEDGGYPYEGQLDYLENQIDPETGTSIIRAIFPNKDGMLYPGRTVQLRFAHKEIPDAVLVTEDAIGSDVGGRYVLLVNAENVVERREVELGPLRDDGLRVVNKKDLSTGKGLDANERYISVGIQKARPEQKVRPELGKTEPASGGTSTGPQPRLGPDKAAPKGNTS